MFMTLVKSLAPWVLFLEQESYLPYINSNYKKLKFTTNLKLKLEFTIYTTILKNHMQKILDVIINENQ